MSSSKQYPYRAAMKNSEWTPAVHSWFNQNLRYEDYRRFKYPEDFGVDVDYLIFDFVNEADAIAFKLKFG